MIHKSLNSIVVFFSCCCVTAKADFSPESLPSGAELIFKAADAPENLGTDAFLYQQHQPSSSSQHRERLSRLKSKSLVKL